MAERRRELGIRIRLEWPFSPWKAAQSSLTDCERIVIGAFFVPGLARKRRLTQLFWQWLDLSKPFHGLFSTIDCAFLAPATEMRSILWIAVTISRAIFSLGCSPSTSSRLVFPA